MATDQTVFISCGQWAPEEKALGFAIQDLVRELTPYTPYFAEDQSSLEGLSRNILGALYRSVGLIAVMHHRGEVRTGQRTGQRASVWIEQEIAIAAFMREVLQVDLKVRAYAQHGLALEGMRQQLILNPKEFTENADVLVDLRAALPTWTLAPQQVLGSLAIDQKIRELRRYIGQTVTVETHGRTLRGPREAAYMKHYSCQVLDCTPFFLKVQDIDELRTYTEPVDSITIATDERQGGRPRLLFR